MNSVFEVVDNSDGDEEVYYTLGLFPSLAAVEVEIMAAANPATLVESDPDEYIKIVVRERTIGAWIGIGKVVATYEWVRDFSNETDTEWRPK